MRAINAVGDGTASTPQAVTPATVPGAPAIVGNTVAGSNLQLSAAFTATGVRRWIADHELRVLDRRRCDVAVCCDDRQPDRHFHLVGRRHHAADQRPRPTSSSCAPSTAIGTGTASAVATGIAQTTPSAPSISSVTPGPSSLGVVIRSCLERWRRHHRLRVPARFVGSGFDTGTLGTSFLISGLTNGTLVRRHRSCPQLARQRRGVGLARGHSTAPLPRNRPITGVTRGDQITDVAVADAQRRRLGRSPAGSTAPTAAVPGSLATATSSPLVITGTVDRWLDRHRERHELSRRRPRGECLRGSAPRRRRPASGRAPPRARQPSSSLRSNQALQVAFTVADNGGSPISAIEYQLTRRQLGQRRHASSPFVIGSLTNGILYTVNVRADNAIGVGSPSIPANATPLTVPDAPTSVVGSLRHRERRRLVDPTATPAVPIITTYMASAFLTPSSPSPVATCTTATTSCSISWPDQRRRVLRLGYRTERGRCGCRFDTRRRGHSAGAARRTDAELTDVGDSFLTLALHRRQRRELVDHRLPVPAQRRRLGVGIINDVAADNHRRDQRHELYRRPARHQRCRCRVPHRRP